MSKEFDTPNVSYALFHCNPFSLPPFNLELGFSDKSVKDLTDCANIPDALGKLEDFCKKENFSKSSGFTLLYPIYLEAMDTDNESIMHNVAWMIKEQADKNKWNFDRIDGFTGKSAADFISQAEQVDSAAPPPSVVYGSTEIPIVVFTLADLLPRFEGDDLESQLQTYDIFLSSLSPTVRPIISNLLLEAAQKTPNEASKMRIMEAARSVADGGRAAAPHDHDEAMKRYREEHKKSFPVK